MLDWIRQNPQLVSNITYFVLLLVWIFYANLLYQAHRRQRTPLVFIHAQGEGPESACFVSNLSAEPVHIECIALVIELEGKQIVQKMTDYARVSPENDDHTTIQDLVKQGPLVPGSFITLGVFENILRRVIRVPDGERAPSLGESRFEEFVRELDAVVIRVVFMHGHYKGPLGAWRRFKLEFGDQGLAVRPTAADTRQLSIWWRRRGTVRRWLRDCI